RSVNYVHRSTCDRLLRSYVLPSWHLEREDNVSPRLGHDPRSCVWDRPDVINLREEVCRRISTRITTQWYSRILLPVNSSLPAPPPLPTVRSSGRMATTTR